MSPSPMTREELSKVNASYVQEKNEQERQAHLRDLELLAVGYGLHKTPDEEGIVPREFIAGSLEQGVCGKELDDLVQCLRTGEPAKLIEWCEARGAIFEQGKSIIQAVVDQVSTQHKSAALKRHLAEVKYAAQLWEPKEVIAKLKEIVEKMEAM